MTDSLPVPDRRGEFSPETYKRAFAIWAWEVDRSYKLTAQRLAELELVMAEVDGRAPGKTPSHDIIRYWAIKDDWPARHHDLLASDRTNWRLYEQQVGQILVMHGNLLRKYAEIINLPISENAPPAIFAAMTKIGEQLQKALKFYGNTGDPAVAPTLTPPRPIDSGPRDRNTVSQEQLARIQHAKKERKGKS